MNASDLPFSLDEFAHLCNKLPHSMLLGIKRTLSDDVPNVLARRGIINDALRRKDPANMMPVREATPQAVRSQWVASFPMPLHVIKTGFEDLYAVVEDSPEGVEFRLVNGEEADRLVAEACEESDSPPYV